MDLTLTIMFHSLSCSRVTVIRGQVVTTSGRGLVGVRITRYEKYQMILFVSLSQENYLHFPIRSILVDPSVDSFI